MYHRKLPFDAAICVLLGYLISLGTGYLAEHIAQASYEKRVEAETPAPGEVGAPALDSTFRAESVADLRAHDTFTIECDDDDFLTGITVYHDSMPMKSIVLPSGERVAVYYNIDNLQYEKSDGLYGFGAVLLPVGRIVADDLSADDNFISLISRHGELDATDFYVDMVGSAVMTSGEEEVRVTKMWTQILTVVILYPLFHAIGSSLGIWGAYFNRKQETD